MVPIAACLLLCFGLSHASSNLDFSWDRLHQCMTPQELKTTVASYRSDFPCLDCRDHFQSLLRIHPFPLDNVRTAQDVRVWTWLTHNLVNERLNKPWASFDVMLECVEPYRT